MSSTRSRQLGQNLTTDLLADLADAADERAVPTGATSPIAAREMRAAQSAADSPRPAPPRRQGPFVETTFFLSARAWQRPSLHWGGTGLTVAAGPVSLRGSRT